MTEAILGLKAVIGFVLWAYYLVVIARVLMSWIRPDPMNPIVRFIHRITDPPLDTLRRLLPFLQAGMIDFTPIALLFLLELLRTVLVGAHGSGGLLDRLATMFA